MVGDIMQPTHLLFVLVVALLVLGPKRLPEVGRQLGNGIRDFRAAMNGERAEPQEQIHTQYSQATTAAPAQPGTTSVPAQPGTTSVPAQPVTTSVPAQPAAAPAPSEHEFAHEPVETVAGDHEFAHVASEPASAGHEFAHQDPQPGAGSDTLSGAASSGEHEFASEPTEPAAKPADPLD